MFDRQTKKFCASVVDALPNLPEDIMQGWIMNPKGLKKVLRDGLCPPAPALGPPLDFTVRVERSFVVLPNWVDPSWITEEFMDLQTTGPSEYDLHEDVEQWLHPDQMSVVRGEVIHKDLKFDNTLADHLGLSDLLAIQKMHIGVFRALFKGKSVFGRKSVVRRRFNNESFAPYLFEYGDRVVLDWRWLGHVLGSRHPALRFRNK